MTNTGPPEREKTSENNIPFNISQLQLEVLPVYDFVTGDTRPFGVDVRWINDIARKRQIHITELLPSQKTKFIDRSHIRPETDEQLPKDYLSEILKRLRTEQHIPSILKHGAGELELASDSRFGLTPTEIKDFVIPETADLLGIDSTKIRLPKISELIYLNWIHHLLEREDRMLMEWTNTEYFDDPQKEQYLGNVILAQKNEHTTISFWPGSEEVRNPLIGFRLIISA